MPSAIRVIDDHGELVGLSDDDHSQYALLEGRAGGQALKGGTAASDNLTLESTADATKGFVLLNPFGGNLRRMSCSKLNRTSRQPTRSKPV